MLIILFRLVHKKGGAYRDKWIFNYLEPKLQIKENGLKEVCRIGQEIAGTANKIYSTLLITVLLGRVKLAVSLLPVFMLS